MIKSLLEYIFTLKLENQYPVLELVSPIIGISFQA
jgi:hypothetical protein